MTSKQLVYEEIMQRTLENNIEENEIFTANDLANSLDLSRNISFTIFKRRIKR